MKKVDRGLNCEFDQDTHHSKLSLILIGLTMLVLGVPAFSGTDPGQSQTDSQLSPANLPQRFAEREPAEAVSLLASALDENRPVDNQQLLDAAREHFMGRTDDTATANAMAGYLSIGEDEPTGLTFRVGQGGRIESPPSMRIAVLDWLSDIDGDEALTISREILELAEDAEEAAVALRNLGRHPEVARSGEFLHYTLAFVSNPQWLEQPSAGFFEGFDALAYSQAYDHLDVLVSIAKNHPNLTGFLAILMDTMIQNDRGAVYPLLMDLPIFGNEFRSMRAVWFARADVRDANQKKALELYLKDSSVTVEEKKRFLELFPLFTRSTAPRLLTEDHLLSIAEMVSIDHASIKFFEYHSAELERKGLGPSIQGLKERLGVFVSRVKTKNHTSPRQ